MIPVNVTIQYIRNGIKETKRIRLGMEDRVGDVVTRLIHDLQLPLEQDDEKISYYLSRQRQLLDESATLLNAGIQENEILQLMVIDPQATIGSAFSGGLLNRLSGKSGGEPLPVSAAFLHLSGELFCHLHHTRALIGRADAKMGYPAEVLDADLTQLDEKRSVSRPHALIVYSSDEFTIRDLYSQRGVLINGVQMSPSKAEVLHDGDILGFGDVKLRFRWHF